MEHWIGWEKWACQAWGTSKAPIHPMSPHQTYQLYDLNGFQDKKKKKEKQKPDQNQDVSLNSSSMRWNIRLGKQKKHMSGMRKLLSTNSKHIKSPNTPIIWPAGWIPRWEEEKEKQTKIETQTERVSINSRWTKLNIRADNQNKHMYVRHKEPPKHQFRTCHLMKQTDCMTFLMDSKKRKGEGKAKSQTKAEMQTDRVSLNSSSTRQNNRLGKGKKHMSGIRSLLSTDSSARTSPHQIQRLYDLDTRKGEGKKQKRSGYQQHR
jgi:hypothetical protein